MCYLNELTSREIFLTLSKDHFSSIVIDSKRDIAGTLAVLLSL